MLWIGGWRSGRQHPPKLTAATDDRDVQRQVLTVILREHPRPLTLSMLGRELLEDRSDLSADCALARAVRDLAVVGLLYSDGLFLLPTRPALHFARLEMG